MDMQERPCPDIVRAYHEAGHATLDLVFGYGLSACSIEPNETAEGVSSRISELVSDRHYLRILAAGEWGEYLSGHDFKANNCDSGSVHDRLTMAPFLLKAAGYDEKVIVNFPDNLTPDMDRVLVEGHEEILKAVKDDFAEAGRLDLLKELASLLVKHRTLPQTVLNDLNNRYPLREDGDPNCG
jgi:hypothetical protein